MSTPPRSLTKPAAVMQMTKTPFTSQLLNASELMRGLSPAMVRQVLPLLDQLTPIYTDLAQGRLEFTPEPEETKRLIRTFYGELCCRWLSWVLCEGLCKHWQLYKVHLDLSLIP